MKILLYFLLIILTMNFKTSDSINVEIIDKEIINHRNVSVVFKNKTNFNFCFLLDTINYERNLQKYIPTFHNPQIKLFENNNYEIPIYENGAFDSGKYDYSSEKKKYSDPVLIFLHSGKDLKLKIPFQLVFNYKADGVNPQFYKIEKNKNYYGCVVYILKSNYIKAIISRKKIDSIQKKGFKFFTGKLVSNKIPLIFTKE